MTKGPRKTQPSACPDPPQPGRDPKFSASFLTSIGLFVHPLRDHNPTDPDDFKRPRHTGWQHLAEHATEADLQAWDAAGYNLGVHLSPSSLVVLDTDTPTAEQWAVEHLPPTPWRTRTAQGRHRYYRLPEGMIAPKNNKPIPGMDRKAPGGYTAAPGSWHWKAGVPYLPEGDWTVPIEELPLYNPSWFPEKERPAPAPTAALSSATPASDRALVLQRAGAYLASLPPGISGAAGHTSTFTAALRAASGFALDDAELFALMAAHFNPRCEPPWNEAELQHKCTDAHAASLEDPRRGHLLSSELDLMLAAVKRLAALHPLEYEKVRKAEAKVLKVRESELDKFVAGAREGDHKGMAKMVMYPEVEPWPDPVDVGALLCEVRDTYRKFVVTGRHEANAVALWTHFTWCIDYVQVAPLLAFISPMPKCGKTQSLDYTGRLSRRPLVASNVSPAATFRIIERDAPTLLIDEADSFLKENEEMRGVFNSGHTRTHAVFYRCVGDDQEPQGFSTWAAKAFASIGRLSATVMDRSIVINLRRKLKTESTHRLRHADPAIFTTLASKMARFAEDHAEAIGQARPNLPDELNDRAQDSWEPLLAIADLAGGEWPRIAREAALALSGAAHDPTSTPSDLLADIKLAFDTCKKEKLWLWTDELMTALIQDAERPWRDYKFGRSITARQISDLLEEFEIHSRDIKGPGGQVKKGYRLEDFKEAIARYIPPVTPPPVPLPATSKHPSGSTGSGKVAVAAGSATKKGKVAAKSATRYRAATSKPAPELTGSGVADPEGGAGEGIRLRPASGDGIAPGKTKKPKYA